MNPLESRIETLEQRIAKLESKLMELEEQIVNLENNQKGNSQSQNVNVEEKSDSLGKKIATKIDNISTGHIVILSLHVKEKQSTLDIQQMIKGWGWSPDTFFEKGHFRADVIKKGLAHDVGTDDNKKSIFSLTAKGELFAKQLIEKHQLS